MGREGAREGTEEDGNGHAGRKGVSRGGREGVGLGVGPGISRREQFPHF